VALPWLAALKIIPWKDVIAATPQVVKGAQKLYDSVKNNPKKTEPPVSSEEIERLHHDPQALRNHVQALHDRLGRLEQEQRTSAELIRDLAEHNERLVAAVDTLRVRTRLLLRMGYGMAIVVLVLAIHAWRT